MPLGIFSSAINKPKPLPLKNKKEKEEKNATLNYSFDFKDSKGTVIKLGKKTYTVKRKLAEGGFALVYLVCDKHNQNFALKRQLIKDDLRQIEACKTECHILKILNHKNIVSYVDHQFSINKFGVFDYMLLTLYYPTNVLQLMNSRLLSNRWLTTQEIFDIFCDVCEAVARLHHSKTPIIHRDLKVENVLVDQRLGYKKPVYVLCDFGSATTKILSKTNYCQEYLEEEIKRYTTISYRAPEMIDLYSGIPITTKSDVWALGVLLYKICYFTLPFGESALAIQNGIFSFPLNPSIPDEIKAIINLLLTLNPKHRPNIFQTSYLIFSAANRKCSVLNIENCSQIELIEALKIFYICEKFGANYSHLFQKNLNNLEDIKTLDNLSIKNLYKKSFEAINTINFDQSNEHQNRLKTSCPAEGVIVNTASTENQSFTTSINPRLRPKVLNTSNMLLTKFKAPLKENFDKKSFKSLSSINSSVLTKNFVYAPSTISSFKKKNIDAFDIDLCEKPVTIQSQSLIRHTKSNESDTKKIFDCAKKQKFFKLQSLSKTPESINNCQTSKILSFSFNSTPILSNVHKKFSSLKLSAFQPYSIIASTQKKMIIKSPITKKTEKNLLNTVQIINDSINFEKTSNPFILNHFENVGEVQSTQIMDDNVFGERFDELRKVNCQKTIENKNSHLTSYLLQQELFLASKKSRFVKTICNKVSNVEFDLTLLQKNFEEDPFGNAPDILPHQQLQKKIVIYN